MFTHLVTALGPTTSRGYVCQCGRPIFLRNTQCLNCGSQLGYETGRRTMVALEPAGDVAVPDAPAANDANAAPEAPTAPDAPIADAPAAPAAAPELWRVYGDTRPAQLFRRCANLQSASACNWLIAADPADPAATPANLVPGHCLVCSLTRTIPDLGNPVNQELWRRLETAKRRLVSQLLALALPVETRLERPNGIAFDMLEAHPGGAPVLTGHDEGLITLNIAEADDAQREQIRADMHESYRTLLGHFRHEIGHYYWDRLVRDDAQWLAAFRALFGDETVDYDQSLQRHYQNGPPPDWPLHYVSSYATTHPWEDWAETWAHYLHMADTVDTAVSFGIDTTQADIESQPFDAGALWQPEHPNAEAFLAFLNSWLVLTQVLNELTRSMGQPDYYPFVLPRDAVAKLQFIHELVRSASTGAAAPAPQAEPAPA